MTLDYVTLAIVLGIMTMIRVAITSSQYFIVKRRYAGIGLWALASAVGSVGFAIMLVRAVRDLPVLLSVPQNVLLVLAVALEYAGACYFAEKKPNWKLIGIALGTLTALLTVFSVFDDYALRTVILHAALVGLRALGAAEFYRSRIASVRTVSLYLGTMMALGAVVYAITGSGHAIAAGIGGAGPTAAAELLFALTEGVLLTTGFILLVNQRLAGDAADARDHFELLYRTNPEATVIADCDGTILRVNEAFTDLLGRPAEELVGARTVDVFWSKPERRTHYAALLERDGFVSDFEAEICAAGGEEKVGLLSSRAFESQGQQQVIAIVRDITERKALEADLARQARTDDLTGLANRRLFIEVASREIVRARRYEEPLSIALLDLDGFKDVNDRFGHAAGDAVLVALAQAARVTVRESDLMARLGGDEFALLMPKTSAEEAMGVLERLLVGFAAAHLPADIPSSVCRASSGIATSAHDDESIDTLLARADAALYRAKAKAAGSIEVA